MPTIVDGKKIAAAITQKIKHAVTALKKRNVIPALAVILVGNDPASHLYARKKGEMSESIGIRFLHFHFPATITASTLERQIDRIQQEHTLSGIIIQLPLPKPLVKAERAIINRIHESLDVDALTDSSLGKILLGTNTLEPPTPGAILEVLRYYKISLIGKRVCIVGRGNLIGKPLANLFLNLPVTLTVCGSNTQNLAQYTKQADILISGVGKARFISGAMVKKGAVVIDAGIVFVKKKIFGDVDFGSVAPRASLITPVPGGVGPITVAKLLENTVRHAERLSKMN